MSINSILDLAGFEQVFGSRRLRASPSLRTLNKFFGSRRLRASPQGYSPWTSVAPDPKLLCLLHSFAGAIVDAASLPGMIGSRSAGTLAAMELDRHVLLVTGGASGLGAACARRFV